MCVLRVTGRTFDPDTYLATSGLTACRVFRVGEPRFASRPDGPRLESSGFTVDVSERAWSDLSGQIEDAVVFMRTHGADIAMLRSVAGVEDLRLDFPVDLRIDRDNVMTQFEYLPPALVSLAGSLDLGIELSIYPPDLERLASGEGRGPVS
jgi:hypothetical protein